MTSAPPSQSTRLSVVWMPSGGTKKNEATAMAKMRAARVHRHARQVCLESCQHLCERPVLVEVDLRRVCCQDASKDQADTPANGRPCTKAREGR